MNAEASLLDVPSQGKRRVRIQRCGPADISPICDWTDCYLQGDYFFRRGHMAGLLRKAESQVWWVLVDDEPAGLVVMYEGSRLHNLYLAPAFRGSGIGGDLVRFFEPKVIRAKTNMLAGDPVPFYQRLGYTVAGVDPNRPWIVEMQPMTPFTLPAGRPAPIAGPNGPPPPPPPMPTATTAPPPAPQPNYSTPAAGPPGQPSSLLLTGDLLVMFLKFAKWQAVSRAKQEEKRAAKRLLAGARAAQHFPQWAWNADLQRWEQAAPPIAGAAGGPSTPALALPQGDHTVSNLDDLVALCGFQIPPQ